MRETCRAGTAVFKGKIISHFAPIALAIAVGPQCAEAADTHPPNQQSTDLSTIPFNNLAASTSLLRVNTDSPGDSLKGVTFDLAETKPGAEPAALVMDVPKGPSDAEGQQRKYRSLGSRMGAAKWEALSMFAYITVSQAYWTKDTTSFHFKDEGWFGENTKNLGIDKLTHAFKTYLFSEFLGARIAAKTGDRARAALPAALLASGLQFYGEVWDGHKEDSGFSPQDIIFNTGGAVFSVLRHTIPGLEEKLDFRLLLVPNSEVYTFKGKGHYEQQRFLLSLELAGFKGMENSPFRFVELQVGYRGKDFSNAERAAGIKPKQEIFFGFALNVKELLFKNSRSKVGRAIGSGLNYFQIPYTGVYGSKRL